MGETRRRGDGEDGAATWWGWGGLLMVVLRYGELHFGFRSGIAGAVVKIVVSMVVACIESNATGTR